MSLKKALATLLATVMMLSLVSCGSKSNEEAPDDASKPTESAESSGKIFSCGLSQIIIPCSRRMSN